MFIPLKMVCIGIDPYPFVRALWYWVGDMLLSLIEIMQWQHANGVPTLLRLTPRIQHRWYQGGIQIPFARSPRRYPGVECQEKTVWGPFEVLPNTEISTTQELHLTLLVFHKPLSPGFLWVPWVSRGTKKGRILHRERSTKAVKMSWAGSKLDWPSGFFQISRWRSRWFAEALTNGHWWWWWWWLLLLLSLWLWLLVIIVIMIHDNHL